MDDYGRDLEDPYAASQTHPAAASPSGLLRRARADRWVRPPLVRRPRTPLCASGLRRRRDRVRHSFDGPTKAGKVRRIPMLPPVLEELARWRRRGDVTRATGLVFHARDGAMHTKGYDAQWAKKWRPAAAIRPEVRFHDLRHTCASHLIMGTWGRAWRLEEVQVVLGHASRTTTERYARLAPDSIRRVANEAVEQWSDDSKAAPGLVNDWSAPNSPTIQVPEITEPPIGFEPTTYGLRNRCSTN